MIRARAGHVKRVYESFRPFGHVCAASCSLEFYHHRNPQHRLATISVQSGSTCMPGPGTTGRVCLCRLAALRLVDHEPVSEYKTARVADEMSVDARRCGHPYVVLGDTCLTGFVLNFVDLTMWLYHKYTRCYPRNNTGFDFLCFFLHRVQQLCSVPALCLRLNPLCPPLRRLRRLQWSPIRGGCGFRCGRTTSACSYTFSAVASTAVAGLTSFSFFGSQQTKGHGRLGCSLPAGPRLIRSITFP